MSGFEQLFPGKLPRLVMFDLDGTLIDSVPDLAAAVDQMLLKLGRKPAGIESVREWVGNGVQMLVRRALANHIDAEGVDDVEAEHALELFNVAYEDGHELTMVYPGVRDTLKWLHKQGVEMALITNKPERFVAPLLGPDEDRPVFPLDHRWRYLAAEETRPGGAVFRDENGQYPGVPVPVCRRFAQ